ncbi:DNA/RNA non-specific endonuclease, partial [Xanthomonas phaseoli]|uniref:DNA/RNA non-specific endonuclease n=1 Tax=Xanthomonas phaseoli TaxID=1985254 RepID=UPI001EE65744
SKTNARPASFHPAKLPNPSRWVNSKLLISVQGGFEVVVDNSGTAATIGTDKVAVPAYVWKAIYEPGVGAGAYLCVNDSSINCDVVSIDDLVMMTNVDPFPSLSASVKSQAIALVLP